MSGQSYFQLISPLICAVFAVGFAAMWLHARELKSLRTFAVSYLLGALALTADFFRPLMTPDQGIYLVNSLFLASILGFASAAHQYYRVPLPWAAYSGVIAVTVGALGWFRYGVDDIASRIVAASAGVGVLFVLSTIYLHRRMTGAVDRILQFLVIVNAAYLFARAGAILLYGSAGLTAENFPGSTVSAMTRFGAAVTALSLAVVLFAIYGMAITKRLTASALTDPLTGLLNRRGFDARMDRIAANLSRAGQSHGFIIADIDHFKSINDEYGHEAGDAVIRSFAAILAGTAREGDLVARWGGEEFIILIVGTDAPTARTYAEAVRSVFGEMDHSRLNGGAVTASFGVDSWRRGDKLRDVYKRADEALYAAKLEGRNQVRMAAETAVPFAAA